MTEYTLAQMIDKLGRNKNLKFQFVGEGPFRTNRGDIIHANSVGRIVNEANESALSDFSLNSKFRLVNEPVDKMTAFKAFSEGKSIYCLLRGSRYDYKPDLVSQFVELRTQADEPISVQEILYGKWFIEEEN
ncbi:hypothetical protein AB8U03_00270 [Clostridium sp. Mt-5]|uniref:Uncharacterized protein n=1 Tax=Clostridium moutaii TaxID=3240932 RepID=A0ABV4BLK9_9CLOT